MEKGKGSNYLSKTATFKETGNWSGMISNLVNGEADLITTAMTLCCNRENAVDYLWTLSTSTSGMAIKGNTVLVSRSEYPRDKPFLLTPVFKQ